MKKLWLQFTSKFGRSILHPQYIAKKVEYEAINEARKYANGKLLDIGCGTMSYREDLLKIVNEYIGLDYPKTKKMYPGAPKPDILADAKKLPFDTGTLDTVLMLQVLEHIDNPELAIKEASRVLKKEGILIISVPFLYPVHDAPYDYFRFTEFALKSLLKKFNLKILHFSRDGTFLEFLLQSLIIFLLKRAKQALQNKKLFESIYALILLIITLPITVITNLLTITLEPVNKLFARFNNDFPLNYTIVARKV